MEIRVDEGSDDANHWWSQSGPVRRFVHDTRLATGETRRTIKITENVQRTSYTREPGMRYTLFKGKDTKTIVGLREVGQEADGTYKLEPVVRQVYRQRYLKTSCTDRIGEFFSTRTGTVGKGKQYKVTAGFEDRTLENGQVQRVLKNRIVDRLHVNRNSYRAATGPGAERSASHYNIGGKTDKLQVAKVGYQAYTNASNVENAAEAARQAGPYVEYAHPERSVGKTSFTDRTAAATCDIGHERQHGWVPTNWINAAAGSTTQIFSAFAIDRAADLATMRGSNRLLAGETARFDARSVVGLAAGTVGRVATNPVPQPIMFLNYAPPDPRG